MYRDPLVKLLGWLMLVGLNFCLLNIIWILAQQFVENVYVTVGKIRDFLRDRREK